MEQKNEDKKQMSRSNKYCMFMTVKYICYNKNQKILSLYLNYVLLYLYNRG